MSNITVLCKVVDNYGDIGVAHRLCRELAGECPITLVVDNLSSYHAICPAIDPSLPMQQAGGITVLDWNNTTACLAYYKSLPQVILQCFQCGYPPWLEEMLFGSCHCDSAALRAREAISPPVTVIDIDYLTAEDWAGEFHKMTSLTRSAHVHKSLFMPGFTPQTGGLLLQGRERTNRRTPPQQSSRYNFCPREGRLGRQTPRYASLLGDPDIDDPDIRLSVLVFGYPRDYSPLIAALSSIDCRVFAAAGAGQASFLDALHKAEHPPVVEVLPMLPQTEWDDMLLGADAAFVRGEDSLAGAALAGVPFVWQAYPQESGAHLKKVEALLERMRPYFKPEQYELLHSVWMMWNKTTADVCETATDRWLSAADRRCIETTLLCRFLAQLTSLADGFARFADCIIANGDMAQNLEAYISKM